MAFKYIYNCNTCGYEYIEQRDEDNAIPYFSICHGCSNGEYVESLKTEIEVTYIPPPEPVVELLVEPEVEESAPTE